MSSYDVTVDLTGLSPGKHKVTIKYNQSLTNLEYMVNPTTVNVTIYDKVSKTKSLSVETLNKDKLDPKLVIDKTVIKSDKVIIKGAAEQLEKVAIVKALFDIDLLVKQEVGTFTIKDVPMKAYDAKGNVIDVEIVPETIDVDVTITSPSKEIPIKIVPKGEVAFGKAITSLDSSTSKVVVYGKQDVLDNINFISANVDVTDLKTNKEFKLELTKPVGITYMSTNSVTVNVSLGTVSEKDITGVRVVTRNLASGYSVSASDESSATVTVNLKGVASVIDTIKSEDIIAYVDLSGLTEGTHEVEVKIEGSDSKISYLSKTKKVTLIIKKQ